MTDIEDHARSILLRGRKQAEQLLIEAQKEGESIKAQARQEGLAEGKQAGLAEGNAAGQEAGRAQAFADHGEQLTALIHALATASAQIESCRQKLEEEAGNDVVRLALAIARKVSKLQGQQDPAVLSANVTEAARLVVRAADVRIVLHPTQRQTLEAALPSLKAQWPSLSHVELIDDESVAPGGCRIRTRGGLIDADLESQIDRVATELLPEPQ